MFPVVSWVPPPSIIKCMDHGDIWAVAKGHVCVRCPPVTRVCIDVLLATLPPKAKQCPWTGLPPEVKLIFMDCAPAEGHADLGGHCCHPRKWWYPGPFCHGPCLYLWSCCSPCLCWGPSPMLLQKFMWISMCCALGWSCFDVWGLLSTRQHIWVWRPTAAGVYIDIHGPHCHQRIFRCSWARLQPESMLL